MLACITRLERSALASILKPFSVLAKTFVSNAEDNGSCGSVNVSSSSIHKKRRELSGIRILDMSRVLAGPYCTMILGDLGAEVIKIERPGKGDETRSWGPPFIGKESVYFLSVNRNKKSVAVDIKTPTGIQIIQQLSKHCDVMIENYLPGKLDSMGLGYNQLSQLNPRLIYCSITGYGPDGPYAERGGYDVVASAIGGLMHITGPKDGDPCRVGVALTDIATGLYAHGAIMAALLHREKTGEGQKIDCSLLSTQSVRDLEKGQEMTCYNYKIGVTRQSKDLSPVTYKVAVLSHLAANYLNSGIVASRLGSGHTSIVPYQVFKTYDGEVVVGAGNNEHFRTLCRVLNLEGLAENPSYSQNKDRVENREELVKVLQKRFRQKTTDEWLQLLEETTLPYGPINDMKQVFNDPQVNHKKLVQTMRHKTAGEVKVVGPAVEYGASPSNIEISPAPVLGEDTINVLQDILGYSKSSTDSLLNNGTIEDALKS